MAWNSNRWNDYASAAQKAPIGNFLGAFTNFPGDTNSGSSGNPGKTSMQAAFWDALTSKNSSSNTSSGHEPPNSAAALFGVGQNEGGLSGMLGKLVSGLTGHRQGRPTRSYGYTLDNRPNHRDEPGPPKVYLAPCERDSSYGQHQPFSGSQPNPSSWQQSSGPLQMGANFSGAQFEDYSSGAPINTGFVSSPQPMYGGGHGSGVMMPGGPNQGQYGQAQSYQQYASSNAGAPPSDGRYGNQPHAPQLSREYDQFRYELPPAGRPQKSLPYDNPDGHSSVVMPDETNSYQRPRYSADVYAGFNVAGGPPQQPAFRVNVADGRPPGGAQQYGPGGVMMPAQMHPVHQPYRPDVAQGTPHPEDDRIPGPAGNGPPYDYTRPPGQPSSSNQEWAPLGHRH